MKLSRVVFMKKIDKITFGACIGPKMVHFLCRGPVLSSFKVKKVFLAIFFINTTIIIFKAKAIDAKSV